MPDRPRTGPAATGDGGVTDPVAVLTDLRKDYGDLRALAGVSLAIDRGEVFGLLGPNGAGKTTLVRLLTGTASPTDGDVTVFDQQPAAVDRARIGVLPQAFGPPARLTARELVAYYAGLYDESRAVESVLTDVGLAAAADRRYESLSGGQRRRACLGTALVNDPDLLVLDEPTAGIDPAGTSRVRELIGTLADAGTTVLVTTHDVAGIGAVADRVGLLDEGRLVAAGAPDSLVAEHGGAPSLLVEGVGEIPDLDLDREWSLADGALRVAEVDPVAVGSIAGHLEDAGVAYDALTWQRPDLETVYLRLTGAPGERDMEGAA